MYVLDLICSNGHKFESMFQNRASFEEQQVDDLVLCPHCNDNSVKQILSPIRIGKHSDREKDTLAVDTPKADSQKILEYIEKYFDEVGNNFSEEALKIHMGESEKKSIRGTATADEEQELKEEGVPIFRIPNIQ